MSAVTLQSASRVRAPRRAPSPASLWAYRILGALLACAFWEITGRRGTLGTSWPPLSDVMRESWNQRDLLTRSLQASLPTMIRGFVYGVLVGAGLAFLPLLVPALRGVSTRLATLINALPVVVLAPVLITILGIDRVQVLVSAISCFFPMFVATAAGLDAARRSHLDVMAVLGARRWTSLRRVRLPAAIPSITDGFRLAAPAAVLGAIFGEWFGAEKGIGAVLVSSMQNFQVELLWSAALLATALSIVALVAFTGLSYWTRKRYT